jgi:predicted ATPase
VRIAFSGSHRVGKTTLLERVAEGLRGYETVDEPYHLLEEDGYEAGDPPSVEDFVAQLERSVAELEAPAGPRRDVLFDRCPVDVLAYLAEHPDGDAFEPDDWVERARDALDTLELIVFVPIEDNGLRYEDADYRRAVDERVRRMLIDEEIAGDVEVMTVSGDEQARAEQVLRRIAQRGAIR